MFDQKKQFKFITKCDGMITNCDSLVYYKVRWTVITNCDSFFITKCDTVYYKLGQVFQSAMIITNWDSSTSPPKPFLRVWMTTAPPPLLISKSGSSTVVNRPVNSETSMYRCVVVHWNERVSVCWNWFTLAPEVTSNGGEMYENTSARPWREERV